MAHLHSVIAVWSFSCHHRPTLVLGTMASTLTSSSSWPMDVAAALMSASSRSLVEWWREKKKKKKKNETAGHTWLYLRLLLKPLAETPVAYRRWAIFAARRSSLVSFFSWTAARASWVTKKERGRCKVFESNEFCHGQPSPNGTECWKVVTLPHTYGFGFSRHALFLSLFALLLNRLFADFWLCFFKLHNGLEQLFPRHVLILFRHLGRLHRIARKCNGLDNILWRRCRSGLAGRFQTGRKRRSSGRRGEGR